MDKFLDIYNLLSLNYEETENLKRSIISNEFELVIKSLPTKKSLSSVGCIAEFYESFEEELKQILLKVLKKKERKKPNRKDYI
jgi:hypothetical protein